MHLEEAYAATPDCCQLGTVQGGASHDSGTPRTSLLKASLSFIRTGAGKTTKCPGSGVLLGTEFWKGGVMGLIGLLSQQCQQAIKTRAPNIQQAR